MKRNEMIEILMGKANVIHEEVEIERILLTKLNIDKVRIRRKVLDVVVKTKNDKSI